MQIIPTRIEFISQNAHLSMRIGIKIKGIKLLKTKKRH